jgi:hypothetical protein
MEIDMFARLIVCTCLFLLDNSFAQAGENTIEGTFTGNGQMSKLTCVSARKGEPFSEKNTIVIIMTERDHSKAQNPAFKAGFGDFGSALIITVFEDGKIIGCEVAHDAHQKKPFSSVGNIATGDFKIAGGKISSKLMTQGEVETFRQKWQVNLSFKVSMP